VILVLVDLNNLKLNNQQQVIKRKIYEVDGKVMNEFQKY